MVRLRYEPTPFDLKSTLVQLLKQIWNCNMHSDKHACVDCLIFEEWCIDFARAKWQSDFIDFDVAIQKKRDTDETFINFDRMNIFKPEEILSILRK